MINFNLFALFISASCILQVEERNCLSADELARVIGLSVIIAKERYVTPSAIGLFLPVAMERYVTPGHISKCMLVSVTSVT